MKINKWSNIILMLLKFFLISLPLILLRNLEKSTRVVNEEEGGGKYKSLIVMIFLK